ncbi:hypothetical protein BYT27DRAFT_7202071 [Phlegmacium glaucopus]|nr:hypothetical protein BYT27DRAFT_7202071 [Phlegmacium glaucopus]
MPPTSNPDAQSQTPYPSGPSRENPPRNSIVGGFVLDNAACVAWGSRIMGEPLNPEVRRDSMAALCLVMRKIERKPYNSFFTMIGPESYRLYMVVTQSKLFRGWKGMDPELIPKFEEGEREAVARELLKAEGVTQFEFRTELY